MATTTRGIRFPVDIDNEIRREMERSRRSWSQVVTDLVEEALKMRRAPGITFTNGPAGRRATVAGSGLDVWEVVMTWQSCNRDYDELRRHYSWLAEPQLRAALNYYELYPEEIDSRLEQERRWTAERLRSELPFTRPLDDG